MFNTSYVLAGALTGLLIGLTGVGGGALMTPILLLVFGVAPTTAIATDLWFAALTKIVSARVHQATGNVDWQVVKRLWYGSLPVASLLVLLVSKGVQVARVGWLNQTIGVVILITAISMLISPKLVSIARQRPPVKPLRFRVTQPVLTVVAGALLGLCVALTSVGAGALGSLILLYLYPLRMTPHRLVATDIVHAIPLAMVAGLGYLFTGMVDCWMLISLLMGSIPSVIAGSLISKNIRGDKLQKIIGVTLIISSIKVLF